MTSPKVSFVVASYNHELYVADLLRSILAQTYEDLELVVVDGGSSDDTASIANEIASGDPRMRVLAQGNTGVVKARNRGVLETTGEYVSVVDSDDLLPPERTKLQVDALDADPRASLVYGDASIIDHSGKPIKRFFEMYPPVPGDFSVELFANYCFVPAASVMFRRSAFLESGPFWGPGPNCDYLKWIELGLLGEAICLPDQVLGSWRLHGENWSTAPAGQRIQQYEDLHLGLADLAERHPQLASRIGGRRLNQRYARCHFMGAFYAGQERSWHDARSEFGKAYRLEPSLVNALGWASTLPLVNLLTGPLYGLAARMRKL